MRANAIQLISLMVVLAISGCASLPSGETFDPASPIGGFAVPIARGIADGEWYPGDLHMHSTHSDGDSAVADVVAWAEEHGLRYLALTDHDTSATGNPSHWMDPGYASDNLVLLYGAEWTTSEGHGNLWAAAPFDYDAIWDANRAHDAESAIAAARARGAVFSLNHPTRLTLGWEYGFTGTDGTFAADTLEVWNGPYHRPFRNQRSVGGLWDDLLSGGVTVNAVGGSDSHDLVQAQRYFNPPGWPTTWVYATEHTAEAILDGLRAGRVTLSWQPGAHRLEIAADSDGDGAFEAMMGDAIPAGGKTTFAVVAVPPRRAATASDAGDSVLCIVYKNGSAFARLRLSAGEPALFEDTPEQGDYYRAVLRGSPDGGPLQRYAHGRTLALTNPIYVGEWR